MRSDFEGTESSLIFAAAGIREKNASGPNVTEPQGQWNEDEVRGFLGKRDLALSGEFADLGIEVKVGGKTGRDGDGERCSRKLLGTCSCMI